MNFSKIQALGNDFIVYGSPFSDEPPPADNVAFLCDRKYGIGADSLIYISKSKTADFFMHIYNPDGFEAEICGNALRCSSKYVHELKFFNKNHFIIETLSGYRSANITNHNITVEIGKPVIIDKSHFIIDGLMFEYTYLSLGNPHCVVFTDRLNDEDFFRLGKIIEQHERFPNKTNVEFATRIDETNIYMRVWERGIGETFSCSTGSCACVAAFDMPSSKTINVHQHGGIISVEKRECGNMFITGKCNTVFRGNIKI